MTRRLAGIAAMLVATCLAHASGWSAAPLFGGDVRSLARDPRDPDRLFAGTAAGQIYVSRDAGRRWEDAGSGAPLAGYVVTSLAFRSDRLWATLQGMWGGGGVAISTDGGHTFTPRDHGLPEEPVYAIAHAPEPSPIAFAALPSGVYRSEDDGESWRLASAAIADIRNVSSIHVDPLHPETVLAGTWRRAYRSDDSGRTWRGVFEGMALDSDVFSIHGVAGHPTELWASTCGWVYRSRDRGEHWQVMKNGLADRRVPCLAIEPSGRLLAGTTSGLYLSTNDGASWQRASTPDLSVLTILVDPDRPGTILLGTEGAGVFVSRDGGATFSPSNQGLVNVRIAGIAACRDAMLVAVRDAGVLSGIYRTTDGGRSFDAESITIPPVTGLAVDGDLVFAATEKGLYQRRGGAWTRLPGPDERILQIDAAFGKMLIVTAQGLSEKRGAAFSKVALAGNDVARSATLLPTSTWIVGGRGTYHSSGTRPALVPAPFAGGQLQRVGEHLLLAGSGGAWLFRGKTTPWQRLVDVPCRVLPTGSDACLVLAGDRASLVRPASEASHPLALEVPLRDVTCALIQGDRVYVGTSGYGLLSTPVPVTDRTSR